MATMELDPLLRKGLRLLHSRSRDSVDQLRALLEEAQRQRQGKTLSSVKDPLSLRKESPIPRSKQSSPSNIVLPKGNEMKRELTHKSRDEEPYVHSSKRPKLDSPHNPFKSHTPSPTPSIKSESSSHSRKSDESDSDSDMNHLAMEIGINCTVCKSFEQTSGNQLVECQECHSLFHQECHKPTVSHQDMTDPRHVWYCAKCSRNLKKQSLSSSSSSQSVVGVRAASSSGSSTSKNLGSLASSRPSPSKNVGMQRPFPFTNLSSVGRSGGGSSSSSSSTAASSSSGSGSSTRSSISTTNTRSSASGPPAANVLLNAERRVHLMKKKAAAKNAERRKI